MSLPPAPAALPNQPAQPTKRVGRALCLSGGGYRAALFHLGALRRFNECGLLGTLDLISSVSGGSILAAHLARVVQPWPSGNEVFPNWDAVVAVPFIAFCRCDIRTPAFFRSLRNPWRLLYEGLDPRGLELAYARLLTPQSLLELPERPRFVFCATELTLASLWRFEREVFGSYRTGPIKTLPEHKVAHAVAASSCFPPVFAPMRPVRRRDRTRNVRLPNGRELPESDLRLSDGGLYDNLGFQPAIDRCATLFVSDGGAPFDFVRAQGWLPSLKRFTDVLAKQVANLRWREFYRLREEGKITGGYWTLTDAWSEPAGRPGCYSEVFAREVIATIRTDLNSFTSTEAGVLENHGYWQAEFTLNKHAESIGLKNLPAPQCPRPELKDERELARVMRDRGRWLPRNPLKALRSLWQHRRLPRHPGVSR